MTMRFGFMTSATPRWTLEQMIAAARAGGYQAIEARVAWGHAAGLELAASKAERRDARRKLDDAGIALACLALGTKLARATAAERAESVDEIARHAELAADLGAPLLRVFGGPVPAETTAERLRDAAAETLGRAAAATADLGVTPCLETHDDFKDPADVAYVVAHAGHPNVGVVWHPVHHLRLGIPVAAGYEALRQWIRHVHVNEGPNPAAPAEEDPIIFGTGDGHIGEVVRTLRDAAYDGVVSWEWLNGRRRDYVDPTSPLAENAARLREYLAAA